MKCYVNGTTTLVLAILKNKKMNYKNFNAIVNTGNNTIGYGGYIKYRKQSCLSRFKEFCNTKFPNWCFMTIYDRKTNEKEVIKRNEK